MNSVKAEEIGLTPNASSAMLIEQSSGQMLYEKDSREKLPPASMTKIMTMLLVMEALEKGELTLDEKVTASEHAASMGGSQIFLEAGESMTVDDLLKGVAIASGNDASMALAEHLAGTEDAFVEKMNQRVKSLGLTDTHFVNPTGLPAKDHYSTAHDMAMMARELLKHENITTYTGTYEDHLRQQSDDPFWLVNTNRLVKFYDGADGLKTGFTSEAKYCLTATAKRNGMRVIAVVMGAPTSKERNGQIVKMFDYAFNRFETHKLYEKDVAVGTIRVEKGQRKHVNAVTETPVSILTPKGTDVSTLTTFIKLDGPLNAPLAKGDRAGEIHVKQDGKTVSKTTLVIQEDVDDASWWTLFKRSLAAVSGQ
nr:D-alanyl-D-alanine carboxypeptidase family protein [Aureibacillus halotolerans]